MTNEHATIGNLADCSIIKLVSLFLVLLSLLDQLRRWIEYSTHSAGLLDASSTVPIRCRRQWINATQLFTGSNIQTIANAFRHRIIDITFNNTTELNSTIYFCRAHHNEFNYSTNPTYLTGSKIRVKTNATDTPVSYITTIGLYNDNNELMAVSKLSEPLKKTPDVEFTLRVRLDY